MIREQTLMRSSNKVAAYIENYVISANPEKKEEILTLFENLHSLFPHYVICTCPMFHPEILYVSKNCPQVLGYSREYLIANNNIEKYFSHIHADDQAKIFDCVAHMHAHLETIPCEEHHRYRTIFYYRFQKADGQFIHLQDERATINLQGAGNLYYSLFRDITAERKFAGVKAELFKQEQHLVKIKDYRPAAEQTLLSKREEQLVSLIRQGLSIKEIAWRLDISPNTVRNIKSKLFEKFNVNNSIELLNMTA
jgi:DNA-binding CsgD family transcriptional regulator